MMEDGQAPTEMPMARLATKLQAFYDGLTADEQPVMASILQQAAEREVGGYGMYLSRDRPDSSRPTVDPSGAHDPTDVANPAASHHDFRARLP